MKKNIVNSCLCISIAFIAACQSAPSKQTKKEENTTSKIALKKVSYQIDTIQKGSLQSLVKLPAQLVANESVSIFPKVNGYVKNVLVDIGSKVKKGQLLMTIEDPELEQATLTQQANYERTISDFTIAKEKYGRLIDADKTPGAISPLDISRAKSSMEATKSVSQAAKAQWDLQKTMVGYLQIRAPFSGTITERNVHPGALVSVNVKDKPTLELKKEDVLRLQFQVPSDLAVELKKGDEIQYEIPSLSSKKLKGKIARISGNIDPKFRSEQMELDVPNTNNEFSPGMYVDVFVTSKPQANTFIVPALAVLSTDDQTYIVAARNNSAEFISVEIIKHEGDKVEVKGSFLPDEKIVQNPIIDMKKGDKII